MGIQDILKKIKDLPTLPVVATKILKMTNNPNSSAADLAKLVTQDPALSAKILKAINSAYYSLNRRVSNIQQAIAYLGMKRVSEIVISVTIFKELNFANNLFSMDKFWVHSIGVAEYGKLIAVLSKKAPPDDVYTAGLLHDIGKMFLAKYLPDQTTAIIKEAHKNKEFLHDVEYKLIRADHTMLGEWLVKLWKLPPYVASCVRYHNTPYEKRVVARKNDDQILTHVIIANNIMNKKFPGYSGSYGEYAAFEKDLISVNVSCDQIMRYDEIIRKKIEESQELLAIIKN